MLVAGGTGPWDRAAPPASPCALTWDLGLSQAQFLIKVSSTEPLNRLLPCLGRQELLWLCHRGVCKKCLPEIFCKLGSEFLQDRLFTSLLNPTSLGPHGRGEVGSGTLCRPEPIADGDFKERQDLSCQTALHQVSPDCFCCRDWQRERLRNKGGTSPHIPHTNICHSSRNKIAN